MRKLFTVALFLGVALFAVNASAQWNSMENHSMWVVKQDQGWSATTNIEKKWSSGATDGGSVFYYQNSGYLPYEQVETAAVYVKDWVPLYLNNWYWMEEDGSRHTKCDSEGFVNTKDNYYFYHVRDATHLNGVNSCKSFGFGDRPLFSVIYQYQAGYPYIYRYFYLKKFGDCTPPPVV